LQCLTVLGSLVRQDKYALKAVTALSMGPVLF